MLSGIIDMEEEAYQCPSGWIMYNALLDTVTCLLAITMVGESMTAVIMMMLAFSAVI